MDEPIPGALPLAKVMLAVGQHPLETSQECRKAPLIQWLSGRIGMAEAAGRAMGQGLSPVGLAGGLPPDGKTPIEKALISPELSPGFQYAFC